MNRALTLTAFAASATLVGCASTPMKPAEVAPPPTASAPAAAGTTRLVKSRDGKYEGEIVGRLDPASKFARLVIGMETAEVQDVLGRAPDRSHTYESGKRWIPFYFGNDARRMQVLYKGEGWLIFTGGNIWGGAGGDLIQINPDPTGACYEP